MKKVALITVTTMAMAMTTNMLMSISVCTGSVRNEEIEKFTCCGSSCCCSVDNNWPLIRQRHLLKIMTGGRLFCDFLLCWRELMNVLWFAFSCVGFSVGVVRA